MSVPAGAAFDGGAHRAFVHDSASKHVTGAAVYIDDMPEIPGTLHVALLGSPVAHGRIRSIDVSGALQAPDVVDVLTAKAIPGENDIGPIFRNEPALADTVVEYVGQPIAAVAARTFDAARAALSRIALDIETLEPVLDIETALAREHYVAKPQVMRRGNVGEALRSSARRVSGKVSCGGQDHFYLEGQVAMTVPHEDRDLVVYSSTQHPTEAQHGVARLLGLPANAITVEVRRLGGAFGGKESQATVFAGLTAVIAARTRRPVKLRLPRDDDMVMTGKRHDFNIDYDVGFDDEGRILALDMTLAARCGNVADLSPPVVTRALCHVDNCYHLPVFELRGYACKTNTVSNTAFRGFGGPQGMLAIETVIEHIARTLGRDPDEVRERNFYGEAPRDRTPYHQRVEDNIAPRIVRELKGACRYEVRKQRIDEFNRANPLIKKGMALMPIKFGISFNLPTLNQAGALLHVYTDGSIHLNHGGTEMGQGLFVKVAQVVSEVFQVDLDRIKISATTTGKVPNTSATAASSGSDLNGMAALDAARQIRARMARVAAEHFEVDAARVEFRDNHVHVDNRSMSFCELAQHTWAARVSLSATGFYRTPGLSWDAEKLTGRPFFYYTYGAAVSEVAVDTLTGETRILRTDILQDCGRSLNPAIDMGQIEGAFVQGAGWLTCEELWWDDSGHLKTHGPSTYKIPGSRDVPADFRVHILEDAPNREDTVFRSKAIGEPPLMLAVSVWLAIRNAVASLSHGRLNPVLDAPATPERVLFAVEDMKRRAADSREHDGA